MSDLRQQLQAYVEDNIERLDTDDVTAVIGQPGIRVVSRWSLRPVWAFVLGASLVLVIGGLTWLLRADEPGVDVVAPPATAPPDMVPLVVTPPGETLLAGTCPPGSNPDALGPADQPRPQGAPWSNQAAVFDEHAGRIIFIDEMGDTWTFDVCSNTWDKANPTLVPADPQSWYTSYNLFSTDPMLVYDVDSDVTIAFHNEFLAVYDSKANTWTQRATPPTYDHQLPGLGAVYDPVSGLVVLLSVETGLVAYDVETDEWTPVGKIGEGEYQAYLIGHIADTDRIGLLRPATNSPRRTSEEFDDEGMVVDLHTGESEGLRAPGDGIFAGFGRLSYATSTQTPVVEADGNRICQLNPVTLDWACVSLADGPDSDGAGLVGAIVGDPINDRVVLIYGYGSGFDGKRFYDVNDIWAIDFETGEWTQLLRQTGEMTQYGR